MEIVRRAYEALSSGDREGLVADMAPTIEYVTTGAVPDTAPVYRGPEAVADFTRWLTDDFMDARVEIHDLIETGDRVLACVTLHGRGIESGVDTSWDVWHLWTLKDGQLVHGQAFTTKRAAHEAAGLSE